MNRTVIALRISCKARPNAIETGQRPFVTFHSLALTLVNFREQSNAGFGPVTKFGGIVLEVVSLLAAYMRNHTEEPGYLTSLPNGTRFVR